MYNELVTGAHFIIKQIVPNIWILRQSFDKI